MREIGARACIITPGPRISPSVRIATRTLSVRFVVNSGVLIILALERVDNVELIPLQEIFRRFRAVEIERPAEESSEGELNVGLNLVNHHRTMLGHVASLPDIAVVEIRQNRFPLDKHPRVIKLPVPLLLPAADLRFTPIAATLARIAGKVG
jgi:hypothetical protein